MDLEASAESIKVSIVIPTFNSARTLGECLGAIRGQRFAAGRVEIIIADAGSTDATLDIARKFGCDHIVANKLQTGEAGKSAGIREARGEIIALVDSDNILDSPDWLTRMLEPFADPDIVASEPILYSRRDTDPALTRYFAMLGMNDPLCLFLGNYDRMCLVTGRWTGLNVSTEDRGSYLKLSLDGDHLPTIGANGFVLRRELLKHVSWDPYFFDIDVVHQAVAAGFKHVAKVKCGIVHLYCSRLRDFTRKQERRVRDYLFFAGERQRTYPWNRQRTIGIVWFVLATVTLFPMIVQAALGWARKRDSAWMYHIPVCVITLYVYSKATIAKVLGIQTGPLSRETWQKPK